MLFKNKKILLVGLGVLGGGAATANFLLREGARLTITDLKSKNDLAKSLKKIKDIKKVKLVLGRHEEKDFHNNEIIVFNQSVPFESPWVKLAQKLKKPIESDLTLFSRLAREYQADYIGITGTRGKTTVSHWLHHFLPQSALGGNIPNKGLSQIISPKNKLYALELSSFQLEFANASTLPPKIAIITNLGSSDPTPNLYALILR